MSERHEIHFRLLDLCSQEWPKEKRRFFFSGLVFARNGNPDAKSLALFQIEIKHVSLTLFFRISLGQFFHGTEWTAEFDLMGDNAVSPAKSLTPSAETAISVQTERKRLYMAHQPILVHKPPLPVIEKSGALFAIVPKPIDGRMLRCSRFGADVGIFFWGQAFVFLAYIRSVSEFRIRNCDTESYLRHAVGVVMGLVLAVLQERIRHRLRTVPSAAEGF